MTCNHPALTLYKCNCCDAVQWKCVRCNAWLNDNEDTRLAYDIDQTDVGTVAFLK